MARADADPTTRRPRRQSPRREEAWPPRLDGIRTPDGRYIVVRGRLWRAANPALSVEDRTSFTRALMDARRRLRGTRRGDPATAEARRAVHRAKVALGERGPVWWDDGAPDYGRKMVSTTPYAEWFARAVAAGRAS